jgi:hypothetical protein
MPLLLHPTKLQMDSLALCLQQSCEGYCARLLQLGRLHNGVLDFGGCDCLLICLVAGVLLGSADANAFAEASEDDVMRMTVRVTIVVAVHIR